MGERATLDFPGSGRPPFVAPVEFVAPTLTERTRTLRVRFSAPNRGDTLRPGLYGTATFETERAAVLTVPRDAIVDTGREQHVFVATNGRFEPRPVLVGLQLSDRVEVRSGLTAGELVVATGVFLLDSESRLRATGGTGGHRHGTPSGDQERQRTAPGTDPRAGHRQSSANDGRPADPHAADRAPAPDPDANYRE